MDLLGATLVGGILTVFGGFGGTLFIRWLDGRRRAERDDRDFHVAAQLTRDELSANIAVLDVTIHHDAYQVPNLSDSVYQDVKLKLLSHLPQDVREKLGDAYIYVRAPRVLATVDRVISGATMQQFSTESANLENVSACREKMAIAREALDAYTGH